MWHSQYDIYGGAQISGPPSVPGTGYRMVEKTNCSCPHGTYSLKGKKNMKRIITYITNIITSWDKSSEGYKWCSSRD